VVRGLAPLLACLALAACGGSGEEDQVREVVEGLYAGFADTDADRICDSLTQKQREAVTKGTGKARSCEQVLSIALSLVGEALKEAKDAKVTDIEVNGDKASAKVEFRGKSSGLGLAKEDGEWKVSDLDLQEL